MRSPAGEIEIWQEEERRREMAHRRLRWERRRRQVAWWLALAGAAAILILSEPERFGFDVPGEQRYQSSQRSRVKLRVRRRLSVRAIADASGSFYREVRRLNPAILRDALPAGTYLINLPAGVSRDLRLPETEPSPASRVRSSASTRRAVRCA